MSGARALVLALALAGGGCALVGTGGTTEMQVTDAAAFAAAHTYRLVSSGDVIPGSDPAASVQLHQAIETALAAELDRKGYRRVQAAGEGSADLRVQYRAAAIDRVERDAADNGAKLARLSTVGGDSAATGYEPIAGSSRSAGVGRLVVFVNDDHSGRVIWQGTAEAEAVGNLMARTQASHAATRLLRDVPRAGH